MSEVVAAAKEQGWRVNIIEAYDQHWKRLLEGTVGGHWGLFDDTTRELKFRFGEPVSDHPDWVLKAGLGIGTAALVFVPFGWARAAGEARWMAARPRRRLDRARNRAHLRARGHQSRHGERAAGRRPAGRHYVCVGARRADGCCLRACAGVGASRFRHGARSTALARGTRDGAILAALLVATVIATIHVALGLVFDPRYKDFPFAALTGPVTALAVVAFMARAGA